VSPQARVLYLLGRNLLLSPRLGAAGRALRFLVTFVLRPPADIVRGHGLLVAFVPLPLAAIFRGHSLLVGRNQSTAVAHTRACRLLMVCSAQLVASLVHILLVQNVLGLVGGLYLGSVAIQVGNRFVVLEPHSPTALACQNPLIPLCS
jgi:hypothetical protein